MHIQKLVLKNFRCFENLDIKLHPNLAVIVGANGRKNIHYGGSSNCSQYDFCKKDGNCIVAELIKIRFD